MIRAGRAGSEENIKSLSITSEYHWIKKNPDLHLRKITTMETERIKASTKENISSFFKKYKDLNRDNNYRFELKVIFLFFALKFLLV
jgi:hypothetical protein